MKDLVKQNTGLQFNMLNSNEYNESVIKSHICENFVQWKMFVNSILNTDFFNNGERET